MCTSFPSSTERMRIMHPMRRNLLNRVIKFWQVSISIYCFSNWSLTWLPFHSSSLIPSVTFPDLEYNLIVDLSKLDPYGLFLTVRLHLFSWKGDIHLSVHSRCTWCFLAGCGCLKCALVAQKLTCVPLFQSDVSSGERQLQVWLHPNAQQYTTP